METAFRVAFVRALTGIMGDVRLLWMPTGAATLEADLSGRGHLLTHSATTAGRLSALGRGQALTFNGTNQNALAPDSDALSSGDGVTDQAFSAIVLANVTDTAAARPVMSRNKTGAQEWHLHVQATDGLLYSRTDQSAGVAAFRLTDAAIAQGAWALFGITYDGRGGATAADGMAIYQNGAVVASTATNNASYVATENSTTELYIGSNANQTAWFVGSMALVAVCAKALSAADHAAIAALCRTYFGVTL